MLEPAHWFRIDDWFQGSGEYEWSNGWYVLYTRWSRNEPSNGGGCVVMYAENGTWADMACEDRKTFICERSRGESHSTLIMLHLSSSTKFS